MFDNIMVPNPLHKDNQKFMDSSSATLLSIGSLFAGAAGSFLQNHFWYAVVCASVAVVCFIVREFVKQ